MVVHREGTTTNLSVVAAAVLGDVSGEAAIDDDTLVTITAAVADVHPAGIVIVMDAAAGKTEKMESAEDHAQDGGRMAAEIVAAGGEAVTVDPDETTTIPVEIGVVVTDEATGSEDEAITAPPAS